MKRVKSFDGTKIAYEYHKGKKKHVLVFLHGVGGNWTTWKHEIEFMQKHNFSTLAIDFRGHGASDVPDKFEKYKTKYFAKDVKVILDKEKIEKYTLIGHSIGGGVAICFEGFHPEPAPHSIILVEPSPIYPFKHNNLLNHGEMFTKMLRHIAYNPKLKSEYFPHMGDCDLSDYETHKTEILKHLMHVTPIRSIVYSLDQGEIYMNKDKKTIEQTFKELECPLLVISAEHDKITPPHLAKKILRLDKLAEFYLVKNATHAVIVEKPEEVSVAIYEFLQQQDVHI